MLRKSRSSTLPSHARAVSHPAGIRVNAVEELSRFDTSVTTAVRVATREFTLGGKTIKKGARVAVLLGAANRDPRRFPDANELNLDRENPRPLSFGHGIHHCIGAALARMELRVGLGAFVEAFGNYTVDPATIGWKESGALRGPTLLPAQLWRTVPAPSSEPSWTREDDWSTRCA